MRALSETITTCTLELYRKVVQNLPPTPSKFHYIFNLRDLSRITHGLCTTTPDRFEEPNKFVRVWRNECLRVYYDRLINAQDKDLVQVKINFLSILLFKVNSMYGLPNLNYMLQWIKLIISLNSI